jgi:hypothetical protein
VQGLSANGEILIKRVDSLLWNLFSIKRGNKKRTKELMKN